MPHCCCTPSVAQASKGTKAKKEKLAGKEEREAGRQAAQMAKQAAKDVRSAYLQNKFCVHVGLFA